MARYCGLCRKRWERLPSKLDRPAPFTSGATPERSRLEGAIPFQATVHLPWERLPGRTPRCVRGVIPSTRGPSPRPAQQVLDSKEGGPHPKDRCRQNLLGMGDCFFFLGVPLRRCVCMSSRRGSWVAWVAFARVPVRCVVFCCLSFGFFLLVGPVPKSGFIFPGIPLVIFYSWLAVSCDVLGLWISPSEASSRRDTWSCAS